MTSIHHTRPGFSVTTAKGRFGRKAIAQGLSKVATVDVVNGGLLDGRFAGPIDTPESGACELVRADVPQAASTSSAAHWKDRKFTQLRNN